MEFRNLLKQHREQLGLTQEEYAKKVRIKRAIIGHIEAGRSKPKIKLLDDLMRPFDLNDEQRREFAVLAATCHIPDALARALVVSIFERCLTLEKRFQRLDSARQLGVVRKRKRVQ